MDQQDADTPTDLEIRMRFMLLAVLDIAEIRNVGRGPIELTRRHLRWNMTADQVRCSMDAFLNTEKLRGLQFKRGSQASKVMRQLYPDGIASKGRWPEQ